MNGTSIDNLRYTQQMPPNMLQQQQFGNNMQMGDNYEEDIIRDDGDMNQLAREVNDSLDNLNVPEPAKPPPSRQRQIPRKEISKDESGIMKKIPQFMREPFIIVLIYVILSFDIVKKTLSSYIPQIKPTADGGVMFIGVVIYAIILAIGFTVAKRILL